jgi:hypothetical protein
MGDERIEDRRHHVQGQQGDREQGQGAVQFGHGEPRPAARGGTGPGGHPEHHDDAEQGQQDQPAAPGQKPEIRCAHQLSCQVTVAVPPPAPLAVPAAEPAATPDPPEVTTGADPDAWCGPAVAVWPAAAGWLPGWVCVV